MGVRYKKMNPYWKAKWVEALGTPPEEGGYVQGVGQLVQTKATWVGYTTPLEECDKFCCLGVLKNLLVEEGHGSWTDHVESKAESYIYEDAGILSDQDAETVGLNRRAMERLITMNDTNLLDFKEIKDWVKEYL